MTAPLSPWCWTPPSARHTAAQHAACQMRQNDPDPRVRLDPCGCQMHGGHETTRPVVERDSRSERDTLGAQVKTAPGARSANCEQRSQGLANATEER